ncbi:MAG: acyltransferase family protein [Paludibacteraceae bacterium]|nr:acyltransferase family protein [Paludibacteraceae bacterium]MBP5664505.1 acyltransferase family protein [Bacteroidales bacterium]
MKQRNYSIDSLKFICAVLVVFLHTQWNFQDEFLPITRCAVPCFFIISGYLLYEGSGIKPERLKRNISHVVKISLWASIFYIVWIETVSLLTLREVWLPTSRNIVD